MYLRLLLIETFDCCIRSRKCIPGVDATCNPAVIYTKGRGISANQVFLAILGIISTQQSDIRFLQIRSKDLKSLRDRKRTPQGVDRPLMLP
jgi:hypothetical protein